MRTTPKKVLALGLTASIFFAACGGDDDESAERSGEAAQVEDQNSTNDDGATEGDNTAADGEFATDDGASTLRANLTSLLQEHVYLAGIAVETAVDAGGDMEAPEVQAAVDALDENSVALADAVGSVAGPENRDAFLGLWREHIGFFVDYTLGKATGDDAAVQQALTDLEGYQQAAGDFFEEITAGELPSDALQASLEEHVSTLTAAIDAVVAGEGDAFAKLQTAAEHMKGAAKALSGAIVAAVPDQFPGSVDSAPAETRATLTYLLQEHTYLAGIALEQAVEAGGDMEAPAVQAAVETLDTNSVALSEVVGSVAGEENGEAFLGLWREHIGFFVDYTLGKATGDQAMVDQAKTDLDGYKQAAGGFFEEITGGELPADAVVQTLDPHATTVFATIDALVAGDGAVFTNLREAGQVMPGIAAALSGGIVAATS